VSEAIARAQNPNEPSGWHRSMFPRADMEADRATLTRELRAMASEERAGVMAKLRGALTRA